MQNFDYQTPTRLIFGDGAADKLPEVLQPLGKRVLLAYGGGSIKKNGVLKQVHAALAGRHYVEFGGIEANPHFETLMQAV